MRNTEFWKIQTRVFQHGKGEWEWVDCEHKSWDELKQDGWEFQYLDDDMTDGAVVVMSRNGYVNEFRNKPLRLKKKSK